MQNISQEEAAKRFDSLPDHLRQSLFSDQNLDTIWKFGEANHLGEQKTKRVADITGAVILGFVHAEDLAREFVSDVGLPADIAREFSAEITRKILAPIMEEINSLYHWGTHVPPNAPQPQQSAANQQNTQPVDTNQQQPAKKEEKKNLLYPVFKEFVVGGSSTKNETQSPFVLHKEETIDPISSGAIAPLDRPQFFKSTAKEENSESPSVARLEIGGDDAPQNKQQVARTEKEVPKMVNYTTPAQQADPFVRPKDNAQPKDIPQGAGHKVSPENIVNLKDLPK